MAELCHCAITALGLPQILLSSPPSLQQYLVATNPSKTGQEAKKIDVYK